MTLWQSTLRDERLLDCELSRTVTALQITKAVDGRPARTRRELEQARSLLGGPTANDLPEPSNDRIFGGVASVIRVLLPVFNIDRLDAPNEKLCRPRTGSA